MASTYLSRTQNGTVNNNKIATFSFWLKRSGISAYQDPMSAVSGSDYAQIQFTNTDTLSIYQRDSGSTTMQVVTTRVFRDTSAWYHIVVALDTTQATASDRVKIYVNGVQETSFGTSTYPTQNLVLRLNTASHSQSVGAYSTSANYVNGSMTHFHQIDGTAYDASTFGETDATTGIWKPKVSPSVTYGTNGFFLKFENSGSMGLDSSPNGNNFTVNGSLRQTVDTPTNVFATLNPLIANGIANPTYSNGNLTSTGTTSTGAYDLGSSTLGISTGKWYWEVKLSDASASAMFGATANPQLNAQTTGYNLTAGDGTAQYTYGYLASNGNFYNDAGGSAFGNSFTTNDIIGVALDCTNSKIYFSKNGVWQGSSDPSAGTGGKDIQSGETYFAKFDEYNSGAQSTINVNFGSGYFGITPVASAGSNGNGAIFEYDVPTGYYALNTKNINTYG